MSKEEKEFRSYFEGLDENNPQRKLYELAQRVVDENLQAEDVVDELDEIGYSFSDLNTMVERIKSFNEDAEDEGENTEDNDDSNDDSNDGQDQEQGDDSDSATEQSESDSDDTTEQSKQQQDQSPEEPKDE